MFVLNNIFKSNLFDNVYPDSTHKMKSILKSQLNSEIKENKIDISDFDDFSILYYEGTVDYIDIDQDNLEFIIDSDYYNSTNNYCLLDYNKYYVKNKVFHRDGDKPAVINYFKTGIPYLIKYYRNGLLHRKNKPAYIEFDTNGELLQEKYYRDGVLHREDNPVIVIWNVYGTYESYIEEEEYYINDVYTRTIFYNDPNESSDSDLEYDSNENK